MELDDMKTAWMRLGTRMDAMEVNVRKAGGERRVRAAHRALRGVGWGQVLQIGIWVAATAVVAPFWIQHRQVPHLLAAGLTLHVYGVATICVCVLELLLVARVSHTAPVVLFQRRLAELQRFRVVKVLALGAPWWVLWVVTTMVGAKLLLDVDLYAVAPRWIQAALGVGASGLALTVWVARRFADRLPASPRLRRLADDMAGQRLARARWQLEEIARFEQEGTAHSSGSH